ncbi:MAG: response regulator transcription factor [Bacteroidetes bacterium]|nr:response regulator transcription factor [Bacteroidota bacterium]
MNARILLVEDNENLGYMLKEYLAMKGFQMEWVKSAHAAKVLLKNKMPELIVLDVGLPDMDGFQLAQWIKITYPAVPFLFLTARVLKIDVLKGFNLGAEDYIKKPIDEEELVMRMLAILNRTRKDTVISPGHFTIGIFNLNKNSRVLSSPDSERRLTAMESKLLVMLSQKLNQVVERSLLLNEIWGNEDYFSRKSMDVFISRLRKYLADDQRIKLLNIHNTGFILHVNEEED